MLSILIPTYNYVCAHLVCDLQKQCEEAQALLGEDFTYEVLVADDGSTDAASIEKNAVIECLPCCRFLDNTVNCGRAAIRNRLIRESRGTWVLVIDSDAEVISDDFILRYVEAATAVSDSERPSQGAVSPTIIIGGLQTPATAPAGCELRHRYELAYDRLRTVEARRKQPAMFFSTFNFMASRSVFEQICFDERCTEYGYEDTLLGIEAARRGFAIVHIDNPLQHNGINDSHSFLANSEAALRTLRTLGPPMTDRARVAQAAHRLGVARPLVLLLYKMSRPLIRRNLLSRHPSLHLFAFYKLGYYIELT